MMEARPSNRCCNLLRCALEVINRVKTTDKVRISTVSVEGEINIVELTTTSSTLPKATLQTQDRVHRRKEKKRRKIEHRQQQQEESTINSEILTSTFFCNSTSNIITLPSDNTPLSIPQSVRAIITVKPLIILDVNGILCHRLRKKPQVLRSSLISNKRLKQTTNFRPSVGNVANTDVVPRSDLNEFLTLLHSNFNLAVWTSATRKTAKILVRLLFPPEIRANLLFVWHRNFCNLVENTGKEGSTENKKRAEIEDIAELEDKALENRKKPSHEDVTAIKSLSKVWSTYPLWNTTNTLLLDDSPQKCPSERQNAVHPKPICGTLTVIEGGANFDNDEENQSSQRCFFELLAKNWTESSSTDYLSRFLKEHAKEYNIGWRQCHRDSSP